MSYKGRDSKRSIITEKILRERVLNGSLKDFNDDLDSVRRNVGMEASG